MWPQVFIDGELSWTIREKQGIRHGGLASIGIFKGRTNPVLKAAANILDTRHIGSINVGAPMCADDICLLSTTHLSDQTALLVAQEDANWERYEFS